MTYRHFAPALIPALFLAACIMAPPQEAPLDGANDITDGEGFVDELVLPEEEVTLRSMMEYDAIYDEENFEEQGVDVPSEDAAMTGATTTAPSPQAVGSSSSPAYVPYADGVLTNGSMKLLFFHASWCPFCVKNDGVLQSLYLGGDTKISTYKIDYDTALDLRSRYGVVTQDTFVLVDGNGEKILSFIHPSESDLKSLLQ